MLFIFYSSKNHENASFHKNIIIRNLSRAAKQHISMISEGSRDTEARNNDILIIYTFILFYIFMVLFTTLCGAFVSFLSLFEFIEFSECRMFTHTHTHTLTLTHTHTHTHTPSPKAMFNPSGNIMLIPPANNYCFASSLHKSSSLHHRPRVPYAWIASLTYCSVYTYTRVFKRDATDPGGWAV